jgi:uncharacterized protein involved in exopolysaccharide biosynthesis
MKRRKTKKSTDLSLMLAFISGVILGSIVTFINILL